MEGGNVPFPAHAAAALDDQVQLNPAKYLVGLGEAVSRDGAAILEHARALRVRDDAHVETTRGELRARHVILATHVPITSKGLFYARVYPYRGYLIGATRAEPPFDGMWINTRSPTSRYERRHSPTVDDS